MSRFYAGPELERKFCTLSDQIEMGADATISGYASLFDQIDQGGDLVRPGAYAASLARLRAKGASVKLLWQHDPTRPIGVWDEVREDARGLHVKGRLLTETAKGREAAVLIKAGAIDGLSIGYRTVQAERDEKGRRCLTELELWEVSLVTFPMLETARLGKQASIQEDLAGAFRSLRQSMKTTTTPATLSGE